MWVELTVWNGTMKETVKAEVTEEQLERIEKILDEHMSR